MLILLYSFVSSGIWAQGLKFKGNAYQIDERTSYSVFGKETLCFKDSMLIEFETKVDNKEQFGYLFRVKTQIPDLTFNVSLDLVDREIIYQLNREGKSRLMRMGIPKDRYTFNQWLKFQLFFNLAENKIVLTIDRHSDSCSIDLPKDIDARILFGRSEYFIDVPECAIRNLEISDKTTVVKYPLDEHKDSLVHPYKGNVIGDVSNPIWLINDSYYWKQYSQTLHSKKLGGFNYNSKDERIYYFNRDSIFVYDMKTRQIYTEEYANNCPLHIRLGDSFYNSLNNSLVVYETYKTQNNMADDVMMAEYNFSNKKWEAITTQKLPTERHHHGRFFDKKNNRLIIFGGFGNALYKNEFYSFNLETNKWNKLSFEGDEICPRYFLSMGYEESENSLYIFGGMGNESGEYNIGRKYFYDLYKVDLDKNIITKIWDLKWDKENVVPVKHMIVDKEDKSFITFCYPEHHSHTFLKLYKFSMLDGNYEILGDSIPISSERITNNAGLFLNEKRNELYGIIQEYEGEDKISNIKIYTLSYPPVSSAFMNKEYDTIGMDKKIIILTIIALSFLIGVFVFIWLRIKPLIKHQKGRHLEDKNEQIPGMPDLPKKPNSIFLFGKFSVVNRLGREIDYMFSVRLKQTLLLILQHSDNEGITSEQLTKALWDDRGIKQAKNIRGVTINGLRKILKELDGVDLIYENKSYKIVVDENICYCDYLRCHKLVNAPFKSELATEFVSVISKGRFLEDENNILFDSWKGAVEDKLEPKLKMYIEDSYERKDYKMAFVLAEKSLNLFPLGDIFLAYYIKSSIKLGLEDKAKHKYNQFISEYNKVMGEDYGVKYAELAT